MKASRKKTKWLFSGILMCAFLGGAVVTVVAQHKNSDGRALCHFTGEATIPYELITVRRGAASSHLSHGDVRPQNGACPSVLPMSWTRRRGNRGEGVTGSSRTGTSSTSGSATSSTTTEQSGSNTETNSSEEGKAAICHREGDDSFHLITVSANAVAAHMAHGDLSPEGGSCFDGDTGGGGDVEPGATPEPITMLLFGVGLAGVGYATRRRLGARSE
jgi:hypothetical protein